MVTEEEIAELLKTPEGRKILDDMLNEFSSPAEQFSEVLPEPAESIGASPYGNTGGVNPADLTPAEATIGASPDNSGATRGPPLEIIGASPDNLGATRGPPLETIEASPRFLSDDNLGAARDLTPKHLDMIMRLIERR